MSSEETAETRGRTIAAPPPVLTGTQPDQDLVDEGFCYLYWRLSYRRRFIRTLWATPLNLGIFLLPASEYPFRVRLVLFILSLVGSAWQAIYNYRKWQAQIKNEGRR